MTLKIIYDPFLAAPTQDGLAQSVAKEWVLQRNGIIETSSLLPIMWTVSFAKNGFMNKNDLELVFRSEERKEIPIPMSVASEGLREIPTELAQYLETSVGKLLDSLDSYYG